MKKINYIVKLFFILVIIISANTDGYPQLKMASGAREISVEIFFNSFSANRVYKMRESEKENLNLYYGEKFIDSAYVFDKDTLKRPIGIRYNPVSKEFVILDGKNRCLYMFSKDGKFVKKIGKVGQGQGEFMYPRFLTIDNMGKIYVFDSENMRITIFDYDGKLVNTLKMKFFNQVYFSFSFTEEGDFVSNLPEEDYYITVLSNKWKVKKNIGKIDRIHISTSATLEASEGFAFKGVNGLYYIYLPILQIVRIYNEKGNILKELDLCDMVQKPSLKDKIPFEQQRLFDGSRPFKGANYIVNNIIYKDSCFFILPAFGYGSDEDVLIFNHNLELIGKYSFGVRTKDYKLDTFYGDLCFEIFDSNDTFELFLPAKYSAKIIQYRFIKSVK